MHHLDTVTEILIRQQQDATAAKLERRLLVGEALAGRRIRQVRFYEPALVSIGRRMVIWGTQLQRRYDDLRPAPSSLAAQPK